MDITENEIKEMLSDTQLEYFNTLPPSYKKNFIYHITSSKTEKTMLKRIEEVKGAMDLECKNVFEYKKKINPREDVTEDMTDVQKIEVYFGKIDSKENRKIIHDLFFQILKDYSDLKPRYAWNQPMITINDSFVLAISAAKNHFSISYEAATLDLFAEKFEECGYTMLKKGFQIKYNQDINYEILKEATMYAMERKRNSTTFWEE